MESLSGYIKALDAGKMDRTLALLYGPDALTHQRQRYLSLLQRMEAWSLGDLAVVVNAPGRTELGGNHTDHNHGVVLAAAVHFDCLAVAAPTNGPTVRIHSEGFSEVIELRPDDLEPRSEEHGTSLALVRGVLHGFREKGYVVAPFDACIAGNVPVGAGLSSSAAFEVCIGQILNQLFNEGNVPPIELARFGRQAENIHFGKPCGFMDQIACAEQGVLSIDFMDMARPVVTPVAYDFSRTGYQLAVVDTGGSHADLTPEYAAIPSEMFRAAKVLGQDAARGLTVERVLAAVPEIRREVGDRGVLRLIHFIEENERAVLQAEALRRGDMDGFISLVKASGDSSWRLLQNCVSTTHFLEQGIPLALVLTERLLGGEGAWRVQGGGFAGSIQVYAPVDLFQPYRTYMEGIFGLGSVVPLRVRQPGNECLRLSETPVGGK